MNVIELHSTTDSNSISFSSLHAESKEKGTESPKAFVWGPRKINLAEDMMSRCFSALDSKSSYPLEPIHSPGLGRQASVTALSFLAADRMGNCRCGDTRPNTFVRSIAGSVARRVVAQLGRLGEADCGGRYLKSR